MKKRILCILLTAVMLLTLIPITAFAGTADEAYAVLENNVLTFYYDSDRASRATTATATYDVPADSREGSGKTTWCSLENADTYKTVEAVVIDASFKNFSDLVSTHGWFETNGGNTSIKSISGLGNINATNITDISRMFSSLRNLESIDFGDFKASNIVDASSLFAYCEKLGAIDVSGLDTSKIENMSHMFQNCKKLTNLDVSNFVTSNVTDMYSMFYGCQALSKIDISGFNTSKVTDMTSMFAGCNKLSSLDVSSFDTSKVENMTSMFQLCTSLTELDLSSFSTEAKPEIKWMFAGCSGLEKIYASEKWNANDCTGNAPFTSCSTNLKGGLGTIWSSDKIGPEFAKIDGGTTDPGYFTIAPHIHGKGTDAITFATPWDGGDGHNSMPTEAGSYYLTNNITISGSWTVSNSINLCLNGFNVVREGGNCITINNGGALSIYDCSNKAHHFDVDSTGLWKLNEDSGSKSLTGGCIMGINPVADQIDGIGIFINGGGTVNMYGGNIVGCKATRDGGGVMVCENATFNMNGGSITGNTAGKFGGGIKCAGTLNLEGGSISNNTASLGGGLDVSGTLNMTNGSIDNNTATDLGGGVNANGTFNMYGGEITNNKATNHSGGVCFNNTAATLGGTAKITNNFVGDTPNNFKLMNGKKVGIGTGDNAPKSGMSIGITMQTPPGQFTNTTATSSDEQYFTSDNNNYRVKYKPDGFLQLENTTIADVLATNTDFPTSNSWDAVPESAWESENGATAHFATNALHLLYQGKGMSTDVTATVTFENGNYVYTYGSTIITFNMTDDVLESITVSGMSEKLDGTYRPVTYYTVTFDTDGGSKVDAQEIADGKLVTEPTRPTKDGYAFVAWVDANGKTFDFNTPITSDVTIKATWEKNPAPTPDPEPISYRITEGANSIWVIAAGERPTFRSNADFSKFSHVLLDGQKLHSSAYKGQSGSTIITLTPEFTATLSVGKHTIEIVSTDGSASTVFYIEETIANTDGEGFALSTATMSSAFIGCNIVGLAVVFFELKKKKVR